MQIKDKVFIVTGGASGLGEGTARMLAALGGKVVIADMQAEAGEAVAKEIGGAANACFVKCDVTSELDVQAVVAKAVSMGKLMGLVNCAGIASAERTVGKNGPHNFDAFKKTITINLFGSFNMLRLAADDGQIGQAAYAASKGGIVGMTLPAARDLSKLGIRVCTIAPGIMGTPMMFGMPQDVQDALAAAVPFPSRLGTPQDYAKLALHIFDNDLLNGETIRLDGAIRLAPK
jgi:NAD(P)-dependent dehydrogenase (short-subunit alcohol dehydrogenase family)